MLGDNLYLENIQEYVQDEDKIVTYKWLSRKLDVPVNAAKRMLYAYTTKCKDSDPINVTYFVSGIVGSNGNTHHEVCLVNEPSLEDTKRRFSQLYSVHVYSVQKAYLKDSGVLFAADYEVTKEHIGDYSKWSMIDYPTSTKPSVRRTPVAQVPTQVAVSKLPMLSHHSKQEKEQVEAKVKVEETNNIESKHDLTTRKTTSKGKVKVQHGKGSVASLFAKQTQKNSENRKEPEKPKVKVEPSASFESDTVKTTVGKGSVASLFAKQTQKNSENTKEPEKPKVKVEPSASFESDTVKTTVVHIVSPKKSPHKSPAKRGRPPKSKESPSKKLTGMFKGLGDSDIEDSESDDEEPKRKKAVSTIRQQKSTKKKGVHESTGSAKDGVHQQSRGDSQLRKRKRVQELSSDEEDFEQHGAQRTKLESNCTGKKAKRRKRYKKMVTKMFTNEDGEMVTEREYEMVSTDASEGEEEEDVKPKPAELQVKAEKHSPAKQTKQASLRSFFGR